MTRLGLIARADCSGLANQTYEVWRHLQPHRTLVLDVHPHRGPYHPERFTGPGEVRVSAPTMGVPTDEEAMWLADETDVIYCAETPSHPGFANYCATVGTRLIVHVNPELYDGSYCAGAELWLPTLWRGSLVPGARVVRFPVATDRLPAREITEVRRLLHLPAAAMLDRNGTEIVHDARPMALPQFEWWHPGEVDEYPDLYAQADALILPRRYAGMCLAMQEAAACGLPIVMLASDVNAYMTIPELLVETNGGYGYPMKGGEVFVHGASGHALATVINRLADPDIVTRASAASRAWAAAHSWDAQLPLWRQELGLDEKETVA